MKPLLDAVPEPLMHGVQSMPHPALQSALDGLYPKGEQWYWRADFVKEVPDDAVREHARFGAAMPTLKSTMHLYPVNGAAARVKNKATAWAYRDATWAAVIVGVDRDPANKEKITNWARDYWNDLHPHSAPGEYVNFMMDEGEDRVKATYGKNYERLRKVKKKYDRNNLFRFNQNIRPAK